MRIRVIKNIDIYGNRVLREGEEVSADDIVYRLRNLGLVSVVDVKVSPPPPKDVELKKGEDRRGDIISPLGKAVLGVIKQKEDKR